MNDYAAERIFIPVTLSELKMFLFLTVVAGGLVGLGVGFFTGDPLRAAGQGAVLGPPAVVLIVLVGIFISGRRKRGGNQPGGREG